MSPASSNSRIAQHTLSVYVSNKPGVLARVAQVFSRKGFNIDSLIVSPAVDGHYSRMTITASGSPDDLQQIIRSLKKLIDVLNCTDHTAQNAVVREMALVKLRVGREERTAVLQIANHFGCKSVDLTETSIILMATGTTDKLDAFANMMKGFTILELVRTGKLLMTRGDAVT